MDGNRFDDLTRTLAWEDGARVSRRVALKGAAAGLLAALGVGKAAGAQVTQAQCGNKICKNNPGLCGDACVCCVYANGNSRCRPPGTCSPGTALCPPDRPVLDSSGLCVAAPGGCSGPADCEDGDPCTTNLCNQGECVTGFVGDGQQGGCGTGRVCFAGGCVDLSCSANGDCWSGICQGETCVATVAGTCTGPSGTCGNGLCACIDVAGTTTCAEVVACIAPGATADVCQMVEPNSTFFASGAWCTGGPGCALGPCPPFPRHCFTGETRIAMADGTSRPIELVAVGDYVLGQGGINRVEAIMRPLLGSKPLYALNDGPFFVTAEHPFLTDTGWKAINPSESEAENPRLVVGRLAVGNRLLALAGVPVLAGGGNAMETVIPELTAVAVEQIRETRADPATQLYNLRLDGDHTYLANDLVVHNK